jgi:hypothetical protein
MLVVGAFFLAVAAGFTNSSQGVAKAVATSTMSALKTQVAGKNATIVALQTQVAKFQTASDATHAATPSSEDREFTFQGEPYQIGETMSALGAVDVVVTGATVVEELDGVRADDEFLVVYADLTYKIKSKKPFPISYFVAVDKDGKDYQEVQLPTELSSFQQEMLNNQLGLAFEPGQVVQASLTYDVPNAADICYLSHDGLKDKPRSFAIYLGC